MELKTARLTLLIDPNKKAAFERLCAAQDRTASQVVRQLIRDYLVEHGVQFVASGAAEADGEATNVVPPADAKSLQKRGSKPRTPVSPTRRRA
jgi:molybdopterin/thiamine biosynthesis adenylyltransferase